MTDPHATQLKRPTRSPGRHLSWLLKLVVTIALIGFVIWQTGLFGADGRAEFIAMLTGVDPFYLSLSFLISILMNLISSYKWHILLVSRNLLVGLWRLFALYYVGRFFNLFLPTSMGGDIARVYQLGKITGTTSESLASVFLERFTGMITLTVVSAVAVLISLKQYDLPIITNSLLLCVILTSLVIWLILDPRPLRILSVIIMRRMPSLNGLLEKISRTHAAIRSYKDDIPTLWTAFAISLVFYGLAVMNVWVSALAFSSDVDFMTILIAVPAIMLIMNLPVSIGGLGLMEAAYTIIFTTFGYSGTLALSTALLIRLKTVIDGIIGGVIYLLRERLPASSMKPESTDDEHRQ
jgi:glycosyltransferase 2 family protein